MVDRTQKRRLLNLSLAGGIALSGLIGMKTQQMPANAIESQTVTIQFEAVVGDRPFACGETYSLGATASAMTPLDFRFYVSEVTLLDAGGNEVPLVLQQDGKWQHQNVALLDFEDKSGACANGTLETRHQIVGSAPAGDYRGLKFTLGIPFGLNHIDSTLAPSPLNLTSLWWNWNFGYKFARIDLAPVGDVARVRQHRAHGSVSEASDPGSANESGGHSDRKPEAGQAFAIHLGSVGCQMDAAQPPVVCTAPNRAEISLTDFEPDQSIVVVDLAALLARTNLAENQDNTALGCMSSLDDGDCAGIMQSLGLPFNNQPVLEQTFFSLK